MLYADVPEIDVSIKKLVRENSMMKPTNNPPKIIAFDLCIKEYDLRCNNKII